MINTVCALDKTFKYISETNGIYTVSFEKKYLYDIDEKTGKKVASKYSEWLAFNLDHKPTVSEIKKVITEYYNNLISKRIKNDFFWNGMSVELKDVDQTNYKAAWDLAYQTNGENLPITFKFKQGGKNVFYTFSDIEELKNFYLAMNKHISACLEEGWKLKEAVKYDLYK